MKLLQLTHVNSGRHPGIPRQSSQMHGLYMTPLQQQPPDAALDRRSQPRGRQPCRGVCALGSRGNRQQTFSMCGRTSRDMPRSQAARRRHASRLRSHPLPQAALEAEEAVTDSAEFEALDGLQLQHDACVRLVSAEGGEYTVEGSMEAKASADSVFRLLCDYERVGAVFSNVLRSQTFRTVGADTRLQQECRWEFLVFSGKFPLELTVSEQAHERRVVFSLASSPFMRSFQGTWQVHEHASGGCRVQHVMAVKPTLAPPRPLAFYTRRVFERQVATIMEDLGRALATQEADGRRQGARESA